MSIHGWDILPISEYRRPAHWNSSGFHIDLFTVVDQILSKSDDRRRSYGVISILQDGGHTVANLLPFTGVVTFYVCEDTKQFAHQISTRYLNPWLRYSKEQTVAILKFYFRFSYRPFYRRRHVIDYRTHYSLYHTLSKRDDRRRSNDVMSILQDGAARRKSTTGFWFGHVSHLRSSKVRK